MLDVTKHLVGKIAIRTNRDLPMVMMYKYHEDRLLGFTLVDEAHVQDYSCLGKRYIVPRNSLRVIDELYAIGNVVYAHVCLKNQYSWYWIKVAEKTKGDYEYFVRTVGDNK